MTVGDRIRKRRIELDLSQEELGKRMGYKSGKAAVSKAELYGDNITTAKVMKFAEALNTTFEDLMGWTDVENLPMPDVAIKNKADQDFEIIQMINGLSTEQRQMVRSYVYFLLSQNS